MSKEELEKRIAALERRLEELDKTPKAETQVSSNPSTLLVAEVSETPPSVEEESQAETPVEEQETATELPDIDISKLTIKDIEWNDDELLLIWDKGVCPRCGEEKELSWCFEGVDICESCFIKLKAAKGDIRKTPYSKRKHSTSEREVIELI